MFSPFSCERDRYFVYCTRNMNGLNMIVEQVLAAGDRNLGYLIADCDSRAAAVIDPSGAPEKFMERIEAQHWHLQYIICTHHHADHVGGAAELRIRYRAALAMHRHSPLPPGLALDDGQKLPLGSRNLHIMHTPGHTADSICIYAAGVVFTGDTLFVGKIGGTPTTEQARLEYRSLHAKLMILPDATIVYPGHDFGVRPSSTIGEEKQQNPFLLQPDFDHFLALKQGWLTYKAEHGIR